MLNKNKMNNIYLEELVHEEYFKVLQKVLKRYRILQLSKYIYDSQINEECINFHLKRNKDLSVIPYARSIACFSNAIANSVDDYRIHSGLTGINSKKEELLYGFWFHGILLGSVSSKKYIMENLNFSLSDNPYKDTILTALNTLSYKSPRLIDFDAVAYGMDVVISTIPYQNVLNLAYKMSIAMLLGIRLAYSIKFSYDKPFSKIRRILHKILSIEGYKLRGWYNSYKIKVFRRFESSYEYDEKLNVVIGILFAEDFTDHY